MVYSEFLLGKGLQSAMSNKLLRKIVINVICLILKNKI